ncbi:ATP-binding protein [Xanthobacter sp. V2C-8]|uniref:ATP-binding protein n=1 Tax=Xanthobacter albus TaxID=3119929 RepID=UPI003729A5A1
MIEALRGLGYSTSTALADIIDNSIAAGADDVQLLFVWDGSASHVRILDNGSGMDGDGLERAMRLGGRSPLEERDPGDLGRFGLGLKTASFSQARRLTVASRHNGATHVLRWDLDQLGNDAEGGGWFMLEGCEPGSEGLLAPLEELEHGTLVLWENPDRIVTAGFTDQSLRDLLDVVEAHLSMVFHCYLEGPRPRLRISINGVGVAPWDPFLTGHGATWSSPRARLGAGLQVLVQAHVLPHQDRLDPRAYRAAAGPDGWTSQQGFYVYRNERLLVAGGWLGLGSPRPWTRDESCRLARIRIDLPNSLDGDWKIDVRKSTARPPANLRRQLTQLADETRDRARRVFAHRGRAQRGPNAAPITEAWRVERLKSGVHYRIDEAHPAIAAVLESAGQLSPDIRAMLKVIEQTVPVQRIWLDTAEARETPRTGFAGEPPATVGETLKTIYRGLVRRRGFSHERAVEKLLNTEPFNDFPELVNALIEDADT